MTNMPYEIDVVSWFGGYHMAEYHGINVAQETSPLGLARPSPAVLDHIEFVNDYVSDLRAQGFEAQVVTYHGPAGGAAVVRFGPGTRSFNELNEFMVETYDPDWFDTQIETN